MADAARRGRLLAAARPAATMGRFLALSRGYWTDPGCWTARLLTLGFVTFTVALVVLAIRLNLWSANLFDALERRDAAEVLDQAGVFMLIVLATVGVTVSHLECKRRLQLGWRRWLTRRTVDLWMAAGHQHQLALLPGDHSNPDARIAEDIRLVTESAFELANSFLYCLLVLISFANILWGLSGSVAVSFGGVSLDIPGHYVWLALVYAGTGTAVAFLLGRPLVRATDARQSREADYRFELVRARERGEAIALLAGEPEERRRLHGLFEGIQASWRLQTSSLRTLTMFSSAYGTLATMFPILIAAPRYLAGQIALGGLMQAAQAFQQFTGALSWPVDNFQRLAEMFTSIERVLVLHDGLTEVMEQHAAGQHATIAVTPARGPALSVRDLSIAHPDGRAMFTGIDAEIMPGERVLILGDPQLTRTFFKVIAGIWPWGAGQVDLPDDATILFVPHRLYFPADTLRQVLAYPDEPTAYATEDFARVLDRVGLQHLRGRLDALEDWESELDRAEQQRLGFAQALLKRPAWLFLEDPGDAMGTESAQALLAALIDDMPGVTLLTISRRPEMEALYHRTLHLEPAADGHVFVRDMLGRLGRPGDRQAQAGPKPPSGRRGP